MTHEWVFNTNDSEHMYIFFREIMRRLYQRPGGSHLLPDIKKTLFRFLSVAGARFITTKELTNLAKEEGMEDLWANIGRAFRQEDKVDRLYSLCTSHLGTDPLPGRDQERTWIEWMGLDTADWASKLFAPKHSVRYTSDISSAGLPGVSPIRTPSHSSLRPSS